jgi:cyclophilin family peptidyl-prolyl cis-trans isomerase
MNRASRKMVITGMVILGAILTTHGQILPDQSMLMARAPAVFEASFETTKGTFTIEVNRNWSPLAADRLYQLLSTHFYDSNGLFRVQKGYVVQFGIGDHPDLNTFWDKRPIPDEPVVLQNRVGMISYARDGLCSRTVQLFINLKDNFKLDTINFNGLRGFPPVARVVSGFEVIEALYGGYGFEPAKYQDSIMARGTEYLRKAWPDLDYILKARIIKE